MKRFVLLATFYAGRVTYGIGAVEYDGRRPVLIVSCVDLSKDPAPVRRLVRACNRVNLDPRDLCDIVADFVDSL